MFLFVLSAIFPVLAMGLFLFFERKVSFFKKLPSLARQAIGGLLLGGCAVFAICFCIDFYDTSLTSVDATLLISSLALGPVSGGITGVIAVVARILHDFLDNGSITTYEVPGIVATSVIAVLAPIVKRFLFRRGTVSWYYGLILGVTFEAMWVLFFYVFFLDSPRTAYEVVSTLGWQTILTVAICTGGALLIMWFLNFLFRWKEAGEKRKPISRITLKNILGIGLLVSLAATLSLSLAAAYYGQSKAAYSEMETELAASVNNVSGAIDESTDIRFTEYAEMVQSALKYEETGDCNQALMDQVALMPLTDASFIGIDGKVAYSSDSKLIGKDLHADFGHAATGLLPLLEATKPNQTIVLPFDEGENKSLGAPAEMILTKGFKIAGISYATEKMKGLVMIRADISEYTSAIAPTIRSAAHNRRIGEQGFLFICSSASTGFYVLSSGRADMEGLRIYQTPLKFIESAIDYGSFGTVAVDGDLCYYFSELTEGFSIFGVYYQREVTFQRDVTFYMIANLLLLVIGIIFLLVFALLDWQVIGKLDRLGDKLEAITEGNLDTKVGHLGNAEFDRLAISVDETIGTMRGYIDREAKRIDHDLALARELQFGALPSVDPLLEMHDFKIGALMTPAKEVGGDFYDFFLLPDGRLAFLIADVSDKGIPAAMFMMRAKAMIHSLCQMRLPCDEVFAQTNRNLYEKNDLNMFITAWLGFLDRNTGTVEYVNAGHNPPLLREGWKYRYLDDAPSAVLGAFSKSTYARNVLKLKPLDGLFLYTDGVTEATDANTELFGEDRLLSFLDGYGDFEPDKMCDSTLTQVREFLGSADQNDDITMVSLTYMGPYVQKDFDYPAKPESYPLFQEEVEKWMDESKLDDMTRANILVCAEEYFINVASYAYKPGKEGNIHVALAYSPYEWTLSFADSGVRFNPLAKENPDVTASFKDRKVGGLGIYMVKQMADSTHYHYLNRQNVNIFGMHTAKAKKGN